MKKALTLLILTTGLTYSQTPSYWLSGDGYNIYNGNRGNVLLGVRSPFASKLAIDPGNEAYGIALTSDQGQYGNYVQIGVLGRNMDILQGRLLFNLHTSNSDLKFAGYDFRIEDKSTFFISGEGNVGIGTLTKNPPLARLQIEGGPKWTADGYNKSLFLGAQDAIGFNGGGYRFGIGATGSSLNFFSTLQESNAQTQRILSLQPNSVTVEGDLIVKGSIYSNREGSNERSFTTRDDENTKLLVPVGEGGGSEGLWESGSGTVFTLRKVGIGTGTPGSYYLSVYSQSGTSDWLARFTNGNANTYLSHGSGYGMHINTGNSNRTDRYALEVRNTSQTHLYVRDDGKIGIGTSSPTYPLSVSGDIYATGGWVRVAGNQGLYFESYGGGFYMSDASWIRTYGNKNFYHNSGILRTDGALQVGPDGNRFLVNSFGNVGVGTASPGTKLDVQQGTVRVWNGSGYAPIQIYSSGNGTHNNANVDIWTYGSGGGADVYMDITNWGNAFHWRLGSGVGMWEAMRVWGGGQASAKGAGNLALYNADVESVRISASGTSYLNGGSVGIGTSNPGSYKLAVNGMVKAKEMYLTVDSGQWSDFVFSSGYKLQSLNEIEQHIKEKGHLPDIPSEKEVVANGVAVVDMQAKLLQKIEELTLYVIEQDKINDEQRKKIELLEKEIRKTKGN